MSKITSKVSEAPGASVPSVEQIESFLSRDLSVAISCLNAIQSDPDLCRHMAEFMHGRYKNHVNSKEAVNG